MRIESWDLCTVLLQLKKLIRKRAMGGTYPNPNTWHWLYARFENYACCSNCCGFDLRMRSYFRYCILIYNRSATWEWGSALTIGIYVYTCSTRSGRKHWNVACLYYLHKSSWCFAWFLFVLSVPQKYGRWRFAFACSLLLKRQKGDGRRSNFETPIEIFTYIIYAIHVPWDLTLGM